MAKVIEVERSYGLDSDSLTSLKTFHKENPKAFPNPYHKGSYYFIWECLWKHCKDNFIPFETFAKHFKADTDSTWLGEWLKRPGETYEKRLFCNLLTMMRVRDYALKPLIVGQKVFGTKGFCLDMQRNPKIADSMLIRLNSNSATPLRPGRSSTPAKKMVQAVKAKTVIIKATKPADKRPAILSGREAIAALKGKGGKATKKK